MAYNYNDESNELVYDLRQKYAEIIGGILEEIALARKEEDFKSWFNWLRNLRLEINQKLNKKEREEYKEILKETLKIINKYPEAYLKHSRDEYEIEEIINCLSELDMWLKDKMELHKMYGAKDYDEGL
jgi:hypothetical protein